MKACVTCGVTKPLSEYHKDRRRDDGRVSICKPCANAKTAKWIRDNKDRARANRKKLYAANRDRAITEAKRWKRENREKANAWHRQWNAANPEKVKAKVAKWKRANPAKWAAILARRRAAKLRAVPVWANRDAIEKVYRVAQFFDWTVDHIVPLQSPLVCGLHVEHNLQVIPMADNARKRNYYWPDMPA